MIKNPWIAAILNFLIPGLGYLYAGKKITFALLLILGMVCYVVWMVQNPMQDQGYTNIWMTLSTMLIMIGFGVDAFNECKKDNKKKK